MNHDEAGFWAAVEAVPGDSLPKLIAADYFDERGRPEGAFLRWLVAAGVRFEHGGCLAWTAQHMRKPLPCQWGRHSYFGWCPQGYGNIDLEWHLPRNITNYLRGRHKGMAPTPGSHRDVRYHLYPSLLRAYEALERAYLGENAERLPATDEAPAR